MIQALLTILRAGWKVTSIWVVALGFAYAPVDTAEFSNAYPRVWSFLEMLDRETLLLLLALGVGLWVGWIDVRPFVKKKWPQFFGDDLEFIIGRYGPLSFFDVFEDEKGDLTIIHVCRIGLRNNSGKSLANVRVRVESIKNAAEQMLLETELPLALQTRNPALTDSILLAKGEVEYWDIVRWELPHGEDGEKPGFLWRFAGEEAGREIPSGEYQVTLAAYSDNTERFSIDVELQEDGWSPFLSEIGSPNRQLVGHSGSQWRQGIARKIQP